MSSVSPSPAHMPKPGPRAAHTPTRAQAKVSHEDPRQFGRIDGDGTVYVRSGSAERAIGQWQAGSLEEGMEHYVSRYYALNTEVELLESRLKSHPGEAEPIRASATQLRESLATAAVIGNLDALDKRLATLIDSTVSAGQQARADKERQRAEAIAAKEALAAEAEELAQNSTEWKVAGDRIRAILEEWKLIRGIDRSTDDALWKRYSRARDSFNRRRGSHFAELDRERASAKLKKQELVEKAQSLQDSTEWNDTARAYRDLMNEWKAAGRAPREVDDTLWAQFRAAFDHFFSARDAVNTERDREFADNAAAKQQLLDEYAPLISAASTADDAQATLRQLQEKWEAIGFVPREQVREFESKLEELEAAVAQQQQEQWRRTDPEIQARVAQFQTKADELQAQAEAAQAKGKTAQAQKLAEQAAQWQEWARTAAAAVES